VRQWFIGKVLRDSCGVPLHKMMSEVAFRFGDKSYRADILVYGKDNKPLAIVECKRPDVKLTDEVAQQALRYTSVLSVQWIFLTSGVETLIFRRDPATGVFQPTGDIPLLG